MKKSLKYLLICVFLATLFYNLKTTSAEIKIGGISYPPIIILPIAIVILAIISLVIYLIYHFSILSRLNKKRNHGKTAKKGKTKEIDKKNPDTHEEKKEKISSSKKKILKIYLPLIQSLKKSQKKFSLSQSSNKFSLLIRRFFKEFYDIDYEFTFDELEKELEKRKQRREIMEFVGKLEVQYDQNPSREQLSELITKFEEILNELTLDEVDKISDILKHEKKELNDLLVDGLRHPTNGSYNEKRNRVIELIQKWENSPEEKQKQIFEEIYGEFGSMTHAERNLLFKKIYGAYEKHNVQVCPGTISCKNSFEFKKQLDYLKGKFEKKVFFMEE